MKTFLYSLGIITLAILPLMLVVPALLATIMVYIITPVFDFVFHSRWGILAVICLCISYIFGYASKKTYEDVSIKSEIMKSLKSTFVSFSKTLKHIEDKKQEKGVTNLENKSLRNIENNPYEIDLSRTNFEGVLKGLAKAINQPNPIFLKGWGNKRLNLMLNEPTSLPVI